MHPSTAAFNNAKQSMLARRAKFLAGILKLNGDQRDDLEDIVLRDRYAVREALQHLGAVQYEKLKAGDLFIFNGQLWIVRAPLPSEDFLRASCYIAGKFVDHAREMGGKTWALPVLAEKATKVKGLLWLDCAVVEGR